MKEVWKNVNGYKNWYRISNFGKISYLTKNGSYMEKNKHVNKSNYEFICLYNRKTKKHTTHYIHRLVAEAFIDNPSNKPQVNHIDGDKSNNCVSNLEWVSCKENIFHSIHTLHNDHAKSLRKPVMCVETGEIYASVLDAEKQLNIARRSISDAAVNAKRYKNGQSYIRRTAGGFHWKFIENDKK